ncbi:MAG: radical SAM protein [Flavobacteriales bacterium]|jgi:radical SAM protein with 4Fe4S-binding SPASM domain|nr:radical SAM protein [Flavobacteriales bacterium]
MKNTYYRPKWTGGRYRKTKKGDDWAIVNNLLEGISYLFKDGSAKIIGEILKVTKGEDIDLITIKKTVAADFSNEDFFNFISQICDVGIVSNYRFSDAEFKIIRKKVGDKRRHEKATIVQEVQEKLPFIRSSSEDDYMFMLEEEDVPFAVILETTYNCNEKCVHCFNPGAARNDEEKSQRNNREEIDIKHYEKLLDELKELGVPKIILTGGDPFVKKDIWKLIELIYERDFFFDLYTNGLGLLGRCEKLAEFFPQSVGLSIYSGVDEDHNSITRVPNSLQKSLKCAEELAILGVPLYFKTPLMKNNVTSYYTLHDLAKKYGAIVQIDVTLTDSVDGDSAITEQLQIDGELLEIVLRDPEIPLYVGPEAPEYGKAERDKDAAFCGAGTNIMSITPEGDITPCNSFPTQFGNLKENSFINVWKKNQALTSWKTIKIQDYDECGTHDRCSFCNRCPGQSFIEHGNPLQASVANCNSANARMELANKLQAGIDPLKGKTFQERLQEIEVEKKTITKNMKNNFRNSKLI